MRLIKLIIPLFCLITVVTMLGFKSNAATNELSFNLKLAPNSHFNIDSTPTKQENVKAKFNKGKDDLKNGNLGFNVKVKKGKDRSDLKIDGAGTLEIGKDKYPFTLVENANGLTSEVTQTSYEGRVYYRAVLQGNITLQDKSEVISIVTYFSEDQKDKFANVVVGSLGKDVYLSFGDNSFLTQSIWKAINNNVDITKLEVNS